MKKSGISVMFGLLFCFATSGEGATFTFKKVVDTATAVPDGTGNFIVFGIGPALDGSNVAFAGSGFGGQSGIYTSIGDVLAVVADTNTPIPGSTGNFTNFSLPALDGGNVAFVGHGSSGQAGLYLSMNGALAAITDSNTPVPGGTGNFNFFEFSALDGSDVAFAGGGPGQRGVFTNIGGSLMVVVDLNTLVPGSTRTFLGFDTPSFDNGDVAFRGEDSSLRAGLYITVGGQLQVLANGSTPVPGGTNFVFFNGSPALEDGKAAFRAEFRALDSSRQQGVFTTTGGPLTAVADTYTAIPGSTGNFDFFGDPVLDGGNLAFAGLGASGQEGIYIAIDGSLMKVIDTNDLLDGKQLSDLSFGRNGLSGNFLTFHARFTDGSEGIFLAEFEPQSVDIDIDIKPGEFPNSVNLKSKGMIPVAILTTTTFDAATVDPLSVRFGPNGATEAHGRGHIEDVDGDGDLDLVLHFRTQDTGLVCGGSAASLTGETFEGDPIQGSDSIRTVGCK